MESVFKKLGLSVIVGVTVGVASCGKGEGSYSVLASGQSFQQVTFNGKVDLLWMIDNSGSMTPLQQNLTNNFNSFISNFVAKGYDFQLAVTASDAYTAGANFRNDPNMAKFRDGVGSTHTGVFTIVPSTPDLLNVFVTNASQGVNGSGDERGFSSFRAALDSTLNPGFVRANSFLGIILLSDEDDFSNPTRAEGDFSSGDHDYNQAGLETTDSYVSYLDQRTGTTGAGRRYSVSSIAVLDETCRAQHAQDAPSTTIGVRYMDLTTKTNGVAGSVCDASFATTLQAIQEHIIELSTQFYLASQPVVESIRVRVNGVLVPQDASQGWTYNEVANSIVFHGSAVPVAGASVSVIFDPKSVF